MAERDETPSERADRNFAELVQELRVAQTGVQILFAFLLTLAFYSSFPHDDETFAYVLTAALVAAACSALCFMAPVAAHRITFRLGGKEQLVWVTSFRGLRPGVAVGGDDARHLDGHRIPLQRWRGRCDRLRLGRTGRGCVGRAPAGFALEDHVKPLLTGATTLNP